MYGETFNSRHTAQRTLLWYWNKSNGYKKCSYKYWYNSSLTNPHVFQQVIYRVLLNINTQIIPDVSIYIWKATGGNRFLPLGAIKIIFFTYICPSEQLVTKKYGKVLKVHAIILLLWFSKWERNVRLNLSTASSDYKGKKLQSAYQISVFLNRQNRKINNLRYVYLVLSL